MAKTTSDLFTFFWVCQAIFCAECGNEVVDMRRPIVFDKDVYAVLLGQPLTMVLYRWNEFKEKVSFYAEKNLLATCDEKSCSERTQPRITLRNDSFEIFFEKVSENMVGLYKATYSYLKSNNFGDASAKPLALVVVYRMPQCTSMLYNIDWHSKSQLSDIDSIMEGDCLQITCITSSLSNPNGNPPKQGWAGVTNRLIMEEKTSNTTQNSLADYHQNHTIIFPVDYTTRLDKIKCSVHIEESISVPSLGSDNQPLPMTHSTKSVFCTIHAPSVMFCPLRAVVIEKRLKNGSTRLTCMANGNPKPYYIWRATTAAFEAVIGQEIVVEQAGYYICTVQTSNFHLNCQPQKVLYHLKLSENGVSIIFGVMMTLALMVLLSAFILLLVMKSKWSLVVPVEEVPIVQK